MEFKRNMCNLFKVIPKYKLSVNYALNSTILGKGGIKMKKKCFKQLIATLVISTIMSTMTSGLVVHASENATSDEETAVSTTEELSDIQKATTTGQSASINTITTNDYNVISTTSQAVKITDFGAKPINEEDSEDFNKETDDSTQAIQKAIDYAAKNNITTVDFGEGTYYAMGIELKSNITYKASGKATLKMLPEEHEYDNIWKYIMGGTKLSNITIDNIQFDGNQKKVAGNGQKGTFIIQFTNSKDITIQNCYLHDSYGAGINFQNQCSNILVKNNKVKNTDVGIATSDAASNYVTFEGNEVWGTDDWIWSEPLGIYNNSSKGLAHHIKIINNKIHDKPKSLGILVQNVQDILIEGNEAYNCCSGITVDEQLKTGQLSSNVIIRNNYCHDNICSNISIAAKDSIVEKNELENAGGYGLWFTNGTWNNLISKNVVVQNNTIKNSNRNKLTDSTAVGEAIHGYGPENCLIQNNTITDDGKQSYNICLQRGESNVIRNNTFSNTSTGYMMYLQKANYTICEGDLSNPGKGNISMLDQGTNNIVLNPGIQYAGGYQTNRTINYGNPWGVTSDMTLIETEGEYDTIPASWKGRQLTVKMIYPNKAKIVPGGNIKLKNDKPFMATASWGSITFVCDGNNWNEVSRDPARVDKIYINTINTSINDIIITPKNKKELGKTAESIINSLPKKVNVTLSNGTSKDLDVEWSSLCPAYNPETNGTYVFIGRPKLESGISNFTDREVVAHIIVSEKQ